MTAWGSAAIIKAFTAAWEHRCDECRQPIGRGEKYLRVVIPAWADMEADESDGRPVAVLRAPTERQWTTLRYHVGPKGCDIRAAGYDWEGT